jgi:protein MAK11
MDTLAVTLPSGGSTLYLATASSDGKIFVFDLSTLDPLSSSNDGTSIAEIHSIASYDTKGSRLTCVCMADGNSLITSSSGMKRTFPEHPEGSGSDSDEISKNSDASDADNSS